MGWARSWINQSLQRIDDAGHRRMARIAQLVLAIGDRVVGDHALRWAASLTFTTILSLMPLLVVIFAMLNAFLPGHALVIEIQNWILEVLFTDSVSQVTHHIEEALKANQGTVGLVGLTFLLVVSLFLFLSVENAFNDVWHAPKSRPLYRRLLTFYAVITLAPALLALGSILGDRILVSLGVATLGATISSLVSWLLVVVALTLMYKLLPHTHVRIRFAVMSAVCAAIVFQLARYGFNMYVDMMYTGSVRYKLYGSFALIPIFFLWVYISWIIILSGVSMSYILQNRIRLERDFDRSRKSGLPIHGPPTGSLLSCIFLVIARQFTRFGGDITLRQIADTLKIDEVTLDRSIAVLSEHGLVYSVTNDGPIRVIPGRPLDRITVGEVFELARDQGYSTGSLALSEHQEFESLVREAELAASEVRGQLTFSDIA
jgi:membrane protein